MDWTSSNTPRPQQPVVSSAPAPAPKRKKTRAIKGMKIASVILLFSAAIVLLGMVFLLAFGKNGNESQFVKNDKMQAVFLNGGQVYFGKVEDINDRYMRMSNIYYLRVNQQVQPNQGTNQAAQNDISLVKLGCELHGPEDEMLLNKEQVLFWENLKTDGQVAKAVDEYIRANPNGQQCTTNQTQNNSNPTGTDEETTDSETTNP